VGQQAAGSLANAASSGEMMSLSALLRVATARQLAGTYDEVSAVNVE